ncbi:MAG: DNA adenine methylase [Sphingomonadaceae bacterium]|nr:DNA adenine methylase [Sphingomonadaceae bacterium]
MTLEPVQPIRPVAPYIGGKRNLAKRLVAMIDDIPHSLYAEPFVGMGGIFFRRTQRPKKEVINDISTDVVNLFRLLQRHYQQLLDVMKWQVCSRSEFERLVALDPSRLTDLERAVRFLYLQRASFGAVGRRYGVTTDQSARFDLTKLVPMLEDAHGRLCGVDIERMPYADMIARYDTPGTLFYLDPPYHGSEDYYGKDVFSEADYEALRNLLDDISGRFILSLNDRPLVRDLFGRFGIEEVRVNYRISGKVTPARELIITGPRPK